MSTNLITEVTGTADGRFRADIRSKDGTQGCWAVADNVATAVAQAVSFYTFDGHDVKAAGDLVGGRVVTGTREIDSLFTEAIDAGALVRFAYKDSTGVETKRLVRLTERHVPRRVVGRRLTDTVLFGGYDLDRDGFRNFRLDRVIWAEGPIANPANI